MNNVQCAKEIFSKYYDSPETIQDMKKLIKYGFSHYKQFRNEVLNIQGDIEND